MSTDPASDDTVVEKLRAYKYARYSGVPQADAAVLAGVDDPDYADRYLGIRQDVADAVGYHEDLGLTVGEAAEKAGVARSTLSYRLEWLGRQRNRKLPQPLTDAQLGAIIRKWHDGGTYQAIATTLGVTYEQVRHAIRRYA